MRRSWREQLDDAINRGEHAAWMSPGADISTHFPVRVPGIGGSLAKNWSDEGGP
jgi:hypothetical protein